MTVIPAQWHGRQLLADTVTDLTRDTYDACRDAITAARTAALAHAEQAFTAPRRDAVEVADELTRRLESARHDAEMVVQDWVSRGLPFARRRWEDCMDRMAEVAAAAAQLGAWQE